MEQRREYVRMEEDRDGRGPSSPTPDDLTSGARVEWGIVVRIACCGVRCGEALRGALNDADLPRMPSLVYQVLYKRCRDVEMLSGGRRRGKDLVVVCCARVSARVVWRGRATPHCPGERCQMTDTRYHIPDYRMPNTPRPLCTGSGTPPASRTTPATAGRRQVGVTGDAVAVATRLPSQEVRETAYTLPHRDAVLRTPTWPAFRPSVRRAASPSTGASAAGHT